MKDALSMLCWELEKLKKAHVVAVSKQDNDTVTVYIEDYYGIREVVEVVQHPFGNFALEGAMVELKNRVKALEGAISNFE